MQAASQKGLSGSKKRFRFAYSILTEQERREERRERPLLTSISGMLSDGAIFGLEKKQKHSQTVLSLEIPVSPTQYLLSL